MSTTDNKEVETTANENENQNDQEVENTEDKGLFDTDQENDQEQENTEDKGDEEDKGLFDTSEDEYEDVFGEDYDKEKLENYKKKYADEDGNFDSKKLLKALHNANKLASQKSPQAPDKYEFEKSEDLEFNFDDGILSSFEEVAKQNNLTNEQFNEIVNQFGKNTKDIYDNAVKEEINRVHEEIKSIDNFQEKASNMTGFFKKNLSKEQTEYLSKNIQSKEMFDILETLVEKASGGNEFIDNKQRQPDNVSDQISEITKKIANEKNSNEREKLFRKRTELYSKL